MRNTQLISTFVAVLGASVCFAQTATINLTSPQDGQTVSAGSMVNWTVTVNVADDASNAGLALVAVDLVQDSGNPELFDIPAGGNVPAAMAGFNRPAGISNPGDDGAVSGYTGVQRGVDGAQNLIQIGGGQNTFGQAGTVMGTDANVDGGVALGSDQEVTSGMFPAPATDGVYTFTLANGIVNVLDSVNPSGFSPVSPATVSLGAGFSFTVSAGPACLCGDVNNDGAVNAGDIDCFVQAVVSGAACDAECSLEAADTNGDNVVNAGDIDSFVDAVVSGACS